MNVENNGLMRMNQLAKRAEMPISTVKFYISRGLLPTPIKDKPNVAYYNESFLSKLMLIKAMREEGLSINSIKSILEKYPIEMVSEWEDFKKKARKKDSYELKDEERLVALSDEERRANDILKAAMVVFAKRGYHSSTVEDIAQEAGVSKGTCYQYFSGKEEMFIATLEITLKNLLREADDAAKGTKDTLARLGVKGLTFISKYQDIQYMFLGIVSEVMGGNEKLRDEAAGLFETVASFLAKDIEVGIKEGVFRDVDPITIAYALIGIAEIVGNRYLLEKDFNVLQFFMNLMDFLQNGLSKD